MITTSYYRLLGLSEGCTLNELKKAYRLKARQYHPDLNRNPAAADLFIRATEAYEFLLKQFTASSGKDDLPDDFISQWETNYRETVRERARYYSQARYEDFIKSSVYKSTRIYRLTTIILGMAFSLMIIGTDIYGYIWLKLHAGSRADEPSLTFMILLLMLGLGFLAFSGLYLISFIQKRKKKK